MAYELRPGQGQLFKNRDRGNNDRAPNLKGTALLQLADGTTVELDIAAWTKESDKAGKWLSLNVKLKGEQPIRQHFDNPTGSREHFTQRVAEMGSQIDDTPSQERPDQDDISF
jgi:hypothetical protein